MRRLTLGLALAALAMAGCKKKVREGAGTGTDLAAAPAAADAAPPAIDAAVAPPVDDDGAASEKVVAEALAGAPYAERPALTADGKRVVWCTAANNGMADFSEVVCHVAPVGKGDATALRRLPVMSYEDAAAIDEASYDDDSADPAAKARAEAARKRVTAAAAQVATAAGPGGRAFPADPAQACTTPLDATTDEPPACTVGGVTVALVPPRSVEIRPAGQADAPPLFVEAFAERKDRPRPPDLDCSLEVAWATAHVDPTARVLAVAVALANPSDACAMVTQYEVRALALP
ncbi:MAG TPA: hypothetical protein VM734_28235 [Kofleriaceae bacterium]|jgi:hypothetical protein|nr:hypothetical protein [Kofleriaceae bacterium]